MSTTVDFSVFIETQFIEIFRKRGSLFKTAFQSVYGTTNPNRKVKIRFQKQDFFLTSDNE